MRNFVDEDGTASILFGVNGTELNLGISVNINAGVGHVSDLIRMVLTEFVTHNSERVRCRDTLCGSRDIGFDKVVMGDDNLITVSWHCKDCGETWDEMFG